MCWTSPSIERRRGTSSTRSIAAITIGPPTSIRQVTLSPSWLFFWRQNKNDGVYGVPIVDEIQRRTGRTVAPAAVYVTLRRLEQKGLLSSSMSAPTPERGGKARRCVKVTPAGLESLRTSRQVLDSMWKGLDRSLRSTK